MSVNSKMTSIANKIRTLLGISDLMGLDAMATNLDAAQTEVDGQSALIAHISETLAGKVGGGGGGSLPGQVTALTAGTFTVDEDMDSYVIRHELGQKPDFYFLVACGDFDLTTNANNVFSILFVLKPYNVNGTNFEGRGQINYVTATNTMSSISSSYPHADSSTIEIVASAAYTLKKDTTYMWIAGTLNGMN